MISRALKQARKGVKQLINESPFYVTREIQATTTDPLGNTVPDPFGTPTTQRIKVRVSHERALIPKNDSTPSGVSTNLTKYLLWEYNVTIQENDSFPELEGYRVGRPDALYKFGGIFGYQAQLIEAN